MLSRRTTLGLLAAPFLASPLHASEVPASQPPPSTANAANRAEVTVIVDPSRRGPAITAGYAGFSYEKSALGSPFFTESNQALVCLFRRLGPSLLRLGGNSVDKTRWDTTQSSPASQGITPDDIHALSTFLRATGWRVLYGINLARNTPAGAAAEARFVAKVLGASLYGFEIGNEPDAYSFNHTRPSTYSYTDFLREWTTFADAIQDAAPGVPLTGPASAWHEQSWTVPFAHDAGQRIRLLTQHYYRANGLSPESTLSLLLAGDPALPGLLTSLWTASRAAGIKDGYRLTEANSFYDGGAPHISNTFGTALWAIEFLFVNAAFGSSGVNFHGGGSAPGYTPISDDGRHVIQIRPEYYGILLFSMMGPGVLLGTTQTPAQQTFSSYAVAGQSKTSVMLVNRDPIVTVEAMVSPGSAIRSAEATVLAAPTLESLDGITLNGAAIGVYGDCTPMPASAATIKDGFVSLQVPPASAVLITMS